MKSLYVIDLTYLVPDPVVGQHLSDHIDFIEQGYRDGLFLASGAKLPRTGGVILAQSLSRPDLESYLSKDPFAVNGIAEFQITEFHASRMAFNPL